jgi:hypothetical protein
LRIMSVLAVGGLMVTAAPRAEAGEFLAIGAGVSNFGFKEGRSEFSSGIDVSGNAWSQYASAILALTGPIHTDGWRFKLAGAYGQYSYDTRNAHICKQIHDATAQTPNRALDKICDDLAGGDLTDEQRASIDDYLASHGMQVSGDEIHSIIPHMAIRYGAAAAPGYQVSLGGLILRAYVGLGYERHDVFAADPGNSLSGGHWGAQGWAEAWLALGEWAWLSADGGYFTGTQAHSGTLKLGLRPVDWLTVGPELATHGDSEDVSGRAGGFVRFNTAGWETTLAAGLSSAYRGASGAYGSANLFVRF